MSQDITTLSAYPLVTRWVDGPAAGEDFPMEAFNRAISHDVQGHQVLLQHVIYLKSIWHSSWPAVRSQRRRLYSEELRSRLEQDIGRVNKLVQFAKAENGVFNRTLPKKSSVAASTNVTLDLLGQARSMMQLLASEIATFPKDDHETTEILTDEILDRDSLPTCRPVRTYTREHIGRPNVTLRIPELEAKQILMKKPSSSPTLVTCSSGGLRSARCMQCHRRPCRCWEQKRAERSDSVISFGSVQQTV